MLIQAYTTGESNHFLHDKFQSQQNEKLNVCIISWKKTWKMDHAFKSPQSFNAKLKLSKENLDFLKNRLKKMFFSQQEKN